MIYSKIAAVKSEIGTLTKKSDNPFFKSKYLELSDLLLAVEPLLEKNGLLLMQPVRDSKVWSEIYDIETGEVVQSYLDLPNIADPQKLGGAITYFRRYTLQALLSLQAVDDDGNEASKAPKKKPTLSQDRFQSGLDKVNDGTLTLKQFQEVCDKYELTEVQSKSLMLLSKIEK